jgi:quinolinate synthase
VDTYANTYSACKSLAESVRSAMESGVVKSTMQTDQDLFEPDLKVYRISQDYYVWQTR